MHCLEYHFDNDPENNFDNNEAHNAERLQESLNRIMQRNKSIITSTLLESIQCSGISLTGM